MKFNEFCIYAVIGLVVTAFVLCLCCSIGLFDSEVETYGFTATVVGKSTSSLISTHYWIDFVDGEESGVVRVTKSDYDSLEINDFININARVIERFFGYEEFVKYTKG